MGVSESSYFQKGKILAKKHSFSGQKRCDTKEGGKQALRRVRRERAVRLAGSGKRAVRAEGHDSERKAKWGPSETSSFLYSEGFSVKREGGLLLG